MTTRPTLALIFPAAALLFALLLTADRSARAGYVDEVLADGPLAYYRFEETTGSTAADSSTAGANHPATYRSGTVLNQPSATTLLGAAVDFPGNTAVQIPDHSDFDLGTGDFTVEMWFNADNSNTTRGDLFTNKGTGGDFGIHSSSQSPMPSISFYFNGFNGQITTGVDQGAWHHLVATRNSGTVSLYVDGAFKTSATDTDSWTITNDLLIGSNHSGDPTNLSIPFDGRIDEVAIYGSGLSGPRVTAHYDAAFIPEPSGLVLAGLALAGLVLGVRRRRIG